MSERTLSHSQIFSELDQNLSGYRAIATPALLLSGSQDRALPLGGVAAKWLATYLDEAREHLIKNPDECGLFLNHRGQKLTRQGLWLIIKTYAEQIRLNGDVTPHTLRHSFATHRLHEGADLQEVQHLLGHASITSTQVYANGNDES